MCRRFPDIQETRTFLGYAEHHFCSSSPITAAKLSWFWVCILSTLSFLSIPKAQLPLCPLSLSLELFLQPPPRFCHVPRRLCGIDMAQGPRSPLFFFAVLGSLPRPLTWPRVLSPQRGHWPHRVLHRSGCDAGHGGV